MLMDVGGSGRPSPSVTNKPCSAGLSWSGQTNNW